MRKLLLSFRACSIFFILLFSLSYSPINGQDNVITELWSESGGVYASNFGIPTAVDGDGNLYRAGFEKQGQGGTDVKLQKIDEEGELLWTVTLNTSSANFYEPSKIYEEGDIIYVTGIVTYLSNGETDFFISKVDGAAGSVDWFVVDETDENDVSADIFYDDASTSIYICGTSERDGTYDMLLASYDDDGEENWLITRDYDSHIDIGAKVAISSGNLVVNGSSQPTATSWDIVSYTYSTGGSFISETRSTGTTTSSDELSDGVIHNNYINLVGKSLQGTDHDFKVICLDANSNVLWINTYDKNNLEDEGIAVVATSNAFVATGFETNVVGNADISVRKFNPNGTLLWSTAIDGEGEDDRGVDIIEDSDGNFLVLSEVTNNDQTDVHIHYVNGSTGSLIWTEPVAVDGNYNENGSSLETNLDGETYVTYEINGQAVTVLYSYTEAGFPTDDEDFSSSSLYISNSGQLKYPDGQRVPDVRYYSFGLSAGYYFEDAGMSIALLKYSNDSITNDSTQRIDIDFVNPNDIHIGQIEEYERDTYFNYYPGELKYEKQATFDVLAYPDIYNDIDAFVSSNSEGFKLSFVLKSGADLDDLELDISGASGVSLSSDDLHMGTFGNDAVWMEPFSYVGSDPEYADDDCITYDISSGNLKFSNSCGELDYPYIIQLKVGAGVNAVTTAINNMDWSTFFGGNFGDFCFDMEVDTDDGDLILVGQSYSEEYPTEANINLASFATDHIDQGLILKFDHDAELSWVTVLTDTDIGYRNKAVALHDNIAGEPGQEIHIVGEIRGTGKVDAKIDNTLLVPATAWQQNVQGVANESDVFFASFTNDGTRLMMSPFSGPLEVNVYNMAITDDGIMYFVGATQRGNTNGLNGSSQTPPNPYDFPVYNPNDGSYFRAGFQSSGPPHRAFVAAIDLSTYKLEYSSIVTRTAGGNTEFTSLYDISFDGSLGAYCGEGVTGARLGFFDPTANRFATTLNQTHSNWTDKSYFSAITHTPSGTVFIGIDEDGPDAFLSTPPAADFQVSVGEAFMVMIDGTISPPTIEWDSYLGGAISHMAFYWHGANITANSEVPYVYGKGRLAYNTATSTLFAGTTSGQDPVQAQSHAGFFHENVNSNILYTNGALGDIGLNSFYQDGTNHLATHTWSTMFGANQTGFQWNPYAYENSDYISNIVSYDLNGKSYVAIAATSWSNYGTTTSDPELFPVVQYTANPDSWYKDENYHITVMQVPFPKDESDFTITRFEVTDIAQGTVSTSENDIWQNELLKIYPNPADNKFTISLAEEEIDQIKVLDMKGKSIIHLMRNFDSEQVTVDITKLVPGIYIVQVNEKYNGRIIKK